MSLPTPVCIFPRVLFPAFVLLLSWFMRPGGAQSCGSTRRRVVVVGAGISGAAAAHHLATSNPCIQVVVLEARDRVGGRMYSETKVVPGLGTVRAEMGGQWIEGGEGNPLFALALQMGLTIKYERDPVLWFAASGRRYSDTQLAAADKAYEALKTKMGRRAENADKDISVAAAFQAANASLYSTPYVQNQVAQQFEFDFGPAEDLSGYYYDSEGYDGDDALVIDGYDTIPKRLMSNAQAAGATLRLGFEVTAISRAGNLVTVTGKPSGGGNSESYSADAVLVTVPLGILKAGVISFTPALSAAKVKAMEGLGMSNGAKVALFYRTKFWDQSADDYSIDDPDLPANRGRFPAWRNLVQPEGQSALLGYALGVYALRRKGDERGLIADAKEKVGLMFPASKLTANAPLETWVKDWTGDPYSRGMYSYARVGTPGNGQKATAFDTMGVPEGRVFFAGEHTTSDYRATVHGAYLSGIREAKRIVTTLK